MDFKNIEDLFHALMYLKISILLFTPLVNLSLTWASHLTLYSLSGK